MARCQHSSGNIQQFTEICLDCGHNIYESDEDYEASLKNEIDGLRRALQQDRIADLEKLRDSLKDRVNKNREDDNDSGW